MTKVLLKPGLESSVIPPILFVFKNNVFFYSYARCPKQPYNPL